jgi:hypothetical protein
MSPLPPASSPHPRTSPGGEHPRRVSTVQTPQRTGQTRVRHHRNDLIIEVSHVVGFMGENYIETQRRHKDVRGEGN